MMEAERCLKHVHAIVSIFMVLVLQINASLSLDHHHANVTSTRCVERERDALLAIKRDLVDTQNRLSSWGTEDCCIWEGVYCDHQTGHVIQLHLGGLVLSSRGEYLTLQGEISAKIIELQHLEYLDLSYNHFNGSQIVPLIGSLSNLRHLDPKYTNLMGSDLSHLDLKYIDLIGRKIEFMIGNLTNLRYLDLSATVFGVEFPYHQLGNLTHHLQYLNLGNNYIINAVENLNWLPHLSSLKYLDLSSTDLSNVFDWLEIVNMLPNLRNLTLKSCDLPPPILSTISHINSSKSLASVDLSNNFAVSSSIFKWLCNYNTTLVHLDLSSTHLSSLVPDVFGSMRSLAYLDLSQSESRGPIPDAFGNMSSLAHLDLSNNELVGGITKSIGQLCSVRGQLFSESVQVLSKCSQEPLEFLDLSNNNLTGTLPNLTNFLSLKELYLFANQLSGIVPESIGELSSLEVLDLIENQFSGIIPESIGKLSSLQILSLDENQFSGMIPESIGQLSSLAVLSLSGNLLSGRIPQCIGKMSLLGALDLSGNRLSGRIPQCIGKMSLLGALDLSGNRLSGRIPESVGHLSKLYSMNLSRNSLEGVISENHFTKLSYLELLDLSSNSLVFNVTSDWVPPFQLHYLNLRSCNVGLDFPQWLRTQTGCSDLDISHAGISDVLPSWFWDLFGNTLNFYDIQTIDFSHNQIRGTFENSPLDVELFGRLEAHFGSNQFEGPIPSILSDALYLDLSNNRFSEITSFLCSPKVKSLKFLNLSSNHVSEELPDCWRSLINLELLDLSNNAFSGKIPTTIGSLLRIETLKLRANRLVGELPSSLKNCTSLKVIDLGNNKLSRSVPEWLGLNLPNLVILMLQSNQFSGSLPSQLCHLTHIQILDFSMNEISGTIPKCLNNLTSLSQEGNSSLTIRHSFDQFVAQAPMFAESPSSYTYYEDDATFMWKGTMYSYKSTLGLVKRIDLSSNRLTGEIPNEITHLVGLVSLNLSRNHLTGQITPNIGNLKSLDSLDLSRNQIDGGIPTSLAQIDRLSFLDLSYNDLSGEIPTGTQLQGFDPSVYAGNPQLCGHPLEKICDPEGAGRPNVSSDPDELITQGFYVSLGLGFAVGFWGVCGSLIFKRSWRYAYYKFLNSSNDWLYVKVTLIKHQLKDTFHRQS